MKVKDWLKQVAYIGDSKIGPEKNNTYYSKFDDSYITIKGMEHNVKFLASRGITEQLTHGVGFSPSMSKWFGWSHRAIFGFTIGSTCKKGDSHYTASNIDEYITQSEVWHTNGRDEESGYDSKFIRTDLDVLEDYPYSNEAPVSLEPALDGMECEVVPAPVSKKDFKPRMGFNIITETTFFGKQEGRESYQMSHWEAYLETYGKGEWIAKNMEDAKQMAVDFNEGVS